MAGEYAANMTPEERALLQKWSEPCSHIVEFGCGGSTILFLEATSAVIDSVDNNRDWVERISVEPRPAEAINKGRLKSCLVDTGPVGRWGLPTDEATRPLWRNYPCAVWDGLRPPAVDLVFVDGRFRIACTVMALLQPQPPIIAFHDFWTRLERYADVLRFVDVRGRAGSLAILAPRPGNDRGELDRMLQRYLDDPHKGKRPKTISRNCGNAGLIEFPQFRLMDGGLSRPNAGAKTAASPKTVKTVETVAYRSSARAM